MRIDTLVIDSSKACSPLCQLGAVHNTDKSPYNSNPALHKHPYTAIYNLLFSSYENKDFVFVELGIEYNASMRMWDKYFTKAKIYGFEYYQDKIEMALEDNLKKVIYYTMNVNSITSIQEGMELLPHPPEIIIDDSTHNFNDQIRIIKGVIPFMPSGGMLIIEDIFRDEQQLRYSEALEEIQDEVSYATFIIANHEAEHTPDWNNSKLLVIYKK
jgi:hypothetical protein